MSLEVHALDVEDIRIWRQMSTLVEKICWKTTSKQNQIVIWVKPLTNDSYMETTPATEALVRRFHHYPDVACFVYTLLWPSMTLAPI